MIKESGLKIYPYGTFRIVKFEKPADENADGLDEAAAKAVEMAKSA